MQPAVPAVAGSALAVALSGHGKATLDAQFGLVPRRAGCPSVGCPDLPGGCRVPPRRRLGGRRSASRQDCRSVMNACGCVCGLHCARSILPRFMPRPVHFRPQSGPLCEERTVWARRWVVRVGWGPLPASPRGRPWCYDTVPFPRVDPPWDRTPPLSGADQIE